MRRAVAALAAAIAALTVPATAAAAPLDELRSSCTTRTSTGGSPVRYRICSAKVPSFDGTPLDVTLTLPATVRPRTRLPLVVFLHGFLNNKGEYLSQTREGTGPDRGAEQYKTVRWNNVWFASRGYAVLSYSARGHGDSGGQINLASRKVEVRDTRYLAGLLVDAARPRIDAKHIGVLGGSYGGGQTWLLLTTRDDSGMPYGSWRSPRGRTLRLATAVPQFTWSDLLYSLLPNGRHLSSGVDPTGGADPTGIAKATLINGLLAQAGPKLPQEAYGWLVRMNAGEPYDDPPDRVVIEAKRALTEDRSAFYQDGYFQALRARRQRRVPVLAAQGWTDPIFPAVEAVRMYRRLRSASPGYPIQLYFGDFEHLSALVKVGDMRHYHVLGNRMLDRYLRGRGRRPRFDVQSAISNCDPKRYGPVVRARDFDSLARRTLAFDLGGPRQTVSPFTDPGGPDSDPVLVSTQRGRGCLTSARGDAPATATYRVPIESGFTLAGMPRLELRYRSAASDLELNSRLWDVAPGGTRTLVTRGAYRATTAAPGGATVAYELFGNAWRFEGGHQLLLEVLQDDSTYFRTDNFASTVTIESARLELPAR